MKEKNPITEILFGLNLLDYQKHHEMKPEEKQNLPH